MESESEPWTDRADKYWFWWGACVALGPGVGWSTPDHHVRMNLFYILSVKAGKTHIHFIQITTRSLCSGFNFKKSEMSPGRTLTPAAAPRSRFWWVYMEERWGVCCWSLLSTAFNQWEQFLWASGERAEPKINIGSKEKCVVLPSRGDIMIFRRRPPAETQGKLFLSNKTHFPSPSAQNEAGSRGGVCVCVCVSLGICLWGMWGFPWWLNPSVWCMCHSLCL